MNTSFMWLVLFAFFLQLCAGQDLRTQFLNPHNDARSPVGAGPLVWDDTIATYAQNYGKQCRGDCALQHSDAPYYRENMFKGTGVEYTPADAVNSWVNEKQYYDYNSNMCEGEECGHYTQVVWKNLQKLECACIKCDNGAIFITCNYDPSRNFVGQKPY